MASIFRRAVCATAAAAIALGPATPVAAHVGAAPPGPGPIGGPRMGEHGLIADPRDGRLPPVSAPSWLIADATSGAVLAAHDPHHRLRPASTQKTLLALTMASRLDPHAGYRADKADTEVEGTHVGLVAGQTYSIDDLWYGLFLRSGNDAANAIAKAGANRDVATAVRMMQAEAHHLQAEDTTVANPSGLDADGQYASAYDLALWGRAALGRTDLRHYFGSPRHAFRDTQLKKSTGEVRSTFVIYTQNRLITSYPGAIGVKSGYTSFAHNTLIAAATRNGRTMLVTVMGTRRNIYEQARLMLDWGFAHPTAAPVGTLVSPLSSGLLGPAHGGPRSTDINTDPLAMSVPNPGHRGLELAGAAAGLGVLVIAGRRRRRLDQRASAAAIGS